MVLLVDLQPNRRDNLAFNVRRDAIKRERDGTGTVCQFNSGDTDLAAMFHKSLPHDDLGQVISNECFNSISPVKLFYIFRNQMMLSTRLILYHIQDSAP